MRVVLDTSVLGAATRSRTGASFALLGLLRDARFEIAISVPLVIEYEAVLLRHLGASALDASDIEALLDYLCLIAVKQEIFFLWRPLLKDPNDDMVVEVASAAQCAAIITHNTRDFADVGKLGIQVLTPGAFLMLLKER